MVKMFSAVLVLLTLLFLAACSKDSYESYIGLWERQGNKRPEVIEISRQGEAYVLNHAVLEAGTDSKLLVLAKAEGQLTFNPGFGARHLVLADKNNLRVANEHYVRITPKRVGEIKAELALQEQARLAARQQLLEQQEQERLALEAQRREREQERAKCQELIDKINVEMAGIKQYGGNNAKWTTEYEKIKQKYTVIAKQYVNCKPDFF